MRAIWHDGQFTYLKSDATRTAGALRAEGRQAGARELPGAAAAPTSCRRCWSAATSRSASAARVRAAGAVAWPTTSKLPAPRRSSIAGPFRAACCRAACRRGSWSPGRRHAVHHLPDRASRRARRRRAAGARRGRSPAPTGVRDYQDRLRAARRAGGTRGSRQAALARRQPHRRRADERRRGTSAGRSARRRATAPGVREPVRQQRRAESSS